MNTVDVVASNYAYDPRPTYRTLVLVSTHDADARGLCNIPHALVDVTFAIYVGV